MARPVRAVTILAVASLAIGIAGNAVVYSLIDSLVNLRLPYSEPDRIVLLGQRENSQPDAMITALLTAVPVWAQYRDRSRTLVDWATMTLEFRSVSTGDRTIGVMVGSATPSFFRVLGEETAQGRIFTDAEGEVGGPKIALLSWDYWRESMGGVDDVVGRSVVLDGIGHDVIGVLPDGYDFLTPEVAIWVPLQRSTDSFSWSIRQAISIARMAPDATMSQVDQELQAIAGDVEAEYPESFRGWTMSATNLATEFPDRQSRTYMEVLRASVFFVLLIACANIANLLLARSEDRSKEIAVRTALGAGRFRILARLSREAMVMALSGGAIGLGLTWVGIAVLGGHMETLPFVPALFHPRLDAGVVALTVVVTVVCGALVGLAPALQSFRVDQVSSLKQAGSGGRGRRTARLVTGLVVGQIALSLVALGGGLVLVRSFIATMDRTPGFDPDNLLVVDLEVPAWKHSLSSGRELLEEVRGRAERLPDVRAATLIAPMPKNLVVQNGPLLIRGETEVTPETPQAQTSTVSPTFLETFGVPLLQGRFFDVGDNADARRVAVVNRALAERHFPNRDPIGEQVTIGDASAEIIGVIGNVQQGLTPRVGGAAWDVVYLPMAQNPRRSIYLAVRTLGPPRGLADPIRSEVWGLDPDVSVNSVETFREYATRYTAVLSIFNQIMSAFALLALLLASIGTYGVIAYSVAQRSREIGVRMSLGAESRTVVRMIAAQGIKMTLLGLGIGAALLVPLLTLIADVLRGFEMDPVTPLSLVWVVLVLFSVSTIASALPARRAAGVDPVSVLRAE